MDFKRLELQHNRAIFYWHFLRLTLHQVAEGNLLHSCGKRYATDAFRAVGLIHANNKTIGIFCFLDCCDFHICAVGLQEAFRKR